MQVYKVEANWLDIEITENIAVEGEFRIAEIAGMFDGLGVSISIDDFGTGYSSLSYLKLFPFDRIKIAKQLVDALTTDHYDLHIVKAICMLARSIGIKTIAEGVEKAEQLDLLVALGCEEIQGYLLGRPMPADLFEQAFLIDRPGSSGPGQRLWAIYLSAGGICRAGYHPAQTQARRTDQNGISQFRDT